MLERGARIRVVDTGDRSIGVDTVADLERVRSLFASES
jgi:CMP-2-keto-3-deoxyoctulosonic acid synthetase